MRKSLFAAAILVILGAIATVPASAAPGIIAAVDAPSVATEVRMGGMHGHRGHGRLMRHRHHRGHGMGHHRGHRM